MLQRIRRLRGRKLAGVLYLGVLVLAIPVQVFAQEAGELGDAVTGGLTTSDALTLTGASIVVSMLVGVLVSALGWTKPANASVKDQFGPLLSILVGVLTVGGLGLSQGADVVSAILVGIQAGWAAMGVHDTVQVASNAS